MSFKPSFTRRKRVLRVWFLAAVSLAVTMLLAASKLDVLPAEFGVVDSAGTDAATAWVIQLGLAVMVLVVLGVAGVTPLTASAEVVLGVAKCTPFGMAASHLSPPVALSLPVTSAVARW